MPKASSVRYAGQQILGAVNTVQEAIKKKKEIEAQLAAIEQFKQFNEQRKSIGEGIPPVIPPNAGAGVGLPPLPMVMNQDMGAPNLQDPATIAAIGAWRSASPQNEKVAANYFNTQKSAREMTKLDPFNIGAGGTIDANTGKVLANPAPPKPVAGQRPYEAVYTGEQNPPQGFYMVDLIDPTTHKKVGEAMKPHSDGGVQGAKDRPQWVIRGGKMLFDSAREGDIPKDQYDDYNKAKLELNKLLNVSNMMQQRHMLSDLKTMPQDENEWSEDYQNVLARQGVLSQQVSAFEQTYPFLSKKTSGNISPQRPPEAVPKTAPAPSAPAVKANAPKGSPENPFIYDETTGTYR